LLQRGIKLWSDRIYYCVDDEEHIAGPTEPKIFHQVIPLNQLPTPISNIWLPHSNSHWIWINSGTKNPC
jgi:hypothetical protein